MLRVLVLPVLSLACLVAQRRHDADSPDRGLPTDPAAFLPYDDDADHPWNCVFRLLWLQELAPEEVAATLPGEGPATFEPGWVHKKRAGTPNDRRWFGGDGRLLPLERLDDDAVEALRALLPAVAADGAPPDLAPELVVWFQHDLLRAAERLLDVERHGELVPLLWGAARAVALDAERLDALRDPLAPALAVAPWRDAFADRLPTALGGAEPGFRELLRRSTRLFDASHSLLWSRVWLCHPAGPAALAQMLPAVGGEPPDVPIGTSAVLVQGIVAVDRDGRPRATRLVVDVRTQELVNRDGLSPDNDTFTRDGIEFGILQLEREGLRQGDPARWFRVVHPDDQDLFRDYGTAKHTTYRGQCSLCHRNSETPEPDLGGLPVLRPHARPRLAATGDERLRLAEEQVARLLARLGAR